MFDAGRGGQYTYHGPGQRVAYVMLDLQRRRPDLRALRLAAGGMGDPYACAIQHARRAARRPHRHLGGRAGRPEAKIAAIGVRVRRWVTYHGVAINLDPELEHFSGIVPCGIRGFGVTSLAALGLTTTMAELDAALMATFEQVFRPST